MQSFFLPRLHYFFIVLYVLSGEKMKEGMNVCGDITIKQSEELQNVH